MTAQSVTPMQRPNHKAKKHPRPMKWHRQTVRAACQQAVARGLGLAEGVGV